MFDEDLLTELREQEIDAQYERAYVGVDDPLGVIRWMIHGSSVPRCPSAGRSPTPGYSS